MKIDRKFMRTLETIKEEGEELFEKIKEFTSEHKKLILISIGLYIVWKYLFSDDEE